MGPMPKLPNQFQTEGQKKFQLYKLLEEQNQIQLYNKNRANRNINIKNQMSINLSNFASTYDTNVNTPLRPYLTSVSKLSKAYCDS